MASISLAVYVAMLVASANASATTQLGDPTLGSAGNSNSGAGALLIQSTSPGGKYAAPFDGVITSWSTFAPGSPQQLKFKVARPLGGNMFTIVGESQLQTLTPAVRNTFATQIPVKAGDVIGIYAVNNTVEFFSSTPGYSMSTTGTDAAPGTTPGWGGPFPNDQINVAATLEPPASNPAQNPTGQGAKKCKKKHRHKKCKKHHKKHK